MWRIAFNSLPIAPQFLHRSQALDYVRALLPLAFYPHAKFDNKDLSLALEDTLNDTWRSPLTVRIYKA
jgi:hypothetical protein